MTLEEIISKISQDDDFETTAGAIKDMFAKIGAFEKSEAEHAATIETMQETIEKLKTEREGLKKLNAKLFLTSPNDSGRKEEEMTIEELSKNIFNR